MARASDLAIRLGVENSEAVIAQLREVAQKGGASLDGIGQRALAAGRSFDLMEQSAGRLARGAGQALGQLGYQVQDFVIQVQSGQNWLIALAQQGSQLAGAFGPAGAAVGALGAALLAAGGAWLGFNAAAGRAPDLIDRTTDALEAGQKAARAYGEQLRSASAELRALMAAQAEQRAQELERAADRTLERASTALRTRDLGEAAGQIQGFDPFASPAEQRAQMGRDAAVAERIQADETALADLEGRLREAVRAGKGDDVLRLAREAGLYDTPGGTATADELSALAGRIAAEKALAAGDQAALERLAGARGGEPDRAGRVKRALEIDAIAATQPRYAAQLRAIEQAGGGESMGWEQAAEIIAAAGTAFDAEATARARDKIKAQQDAAARTMEEGRKRDREILARMKADLAQMAEGTEEAFKAAGQEAALRLSDSATPEAQAEARRLGEEMARRRWQEQEARRQAAADAAQRAKGEAAQRQNEAVSARLHIAELKAFGADTSPEGISRARIESQMAQAQQRMAAMARAGQGESPLAVLEQIDQYRDSLKGLDRLGDIQARVEGFTSALSENVDPKFRKAIEDRARALAEEEMRLREAKEAEQERLQLLQEGEQLIRAYGGAEAFRRQELERLNRIRAAGGVDQGTYRRARRDIEHEALTRDEDNPLAGMQAGMMDIGREIGTMNQNIREGTVGAWRMASQALSDYVSTGKADIKGLFQSALQDMTDLASQMAVYGLMNMAMTGIQSAAMGFMSWWNAPTALAAGSATGAAPVGSVFQARPSGSPGWVYHEGGMVGAAREMRLLAPGAFADAPRFHAGYGGDPVADRYDRLQPGEFRAILQEGEQVLSRREVQALRAAGLDARELAARAMVGPTLPRFHDGLDPPEPAQVLRGLPAAPPQAQAARDSRAVSNRWNINVDAKGSTNPAMTAALVKRAIEGAKAAWMDEALRNPGARAAMGSG